MPQYTSIIIAKTSNNIKKISTIPTLIVHNRLDFVCPLGGAYRLHKVMSNSKLVVVPDKGHVSTLLHKTINDEIKKEIL